MPTERMEEVEVVANCTRCGGMSPACHVCKGSGYEVVTLPAASGSLTAARLRLADAAEKWHKAARLQIRNGQPDSALDQAWMAFQQECEALRTARGT